MTGVYLLNILLITSKIGKSEQEQKEAKQAFYLTSIILLIHLTINVLC